MRRSLIAAGVLVMLYATVGAAADLGGRAGGVVIFLVVVLVAHDAVWMPLVLLTGRFVRSPAARVAWAVAAALTVAALPLALGVGRTADNPSALPLDYGRNLVLVLAAVAGIALIGRKISTIRERRKDR